MESSAFLNENLLNEFESSLGTKPVPLQVVLKDGDEFKEVQPLFTLKANGDIERNAADGTDEAWMVSTCYIIIVSPIVPVLGISIYFICW